MSIAERGAPSDESFPASIPPLDDERPEADRQVLHRLHLVRKQQGISLQNAARRLGIDVELAREQEKAASDLPLSVLYQWQAVLEVPVHELLIDADSSLSPPVLVRARLIKLMKTAVALLENCGSQMSIRRMVLQLMDQLVEIMPELKTVGGWHAIGQPRGATDYGRALERAISEDFFRDA